jgi:RimJ/RimL family protein N-acetyltransferase
MRIVGTQVVVRDERREGDAEDLFRWLNLEEWHYYDTPDEPFEGIGREAYEKRRQAQRQRRKEPSPDSYGWHVDTVEGRHIGWVNYYQLDQEARRAYVGICLPEEETWSKGYGTEALTLLVDHLFREMGLEEVRTATWTGNRRMVRCAEKSGFREVARMPHRAEISIRGEPLERIEFSISRATWLGSEDDG